MEYERLAGCCMLCYVIICCAHVFGSVMCFIWLSQKGLHEWTFPASAIRGVRYCMLLGMVSTKFSIPCKQKEALEFMQQFITPGRAGLFWPQATDFH